MKKYTDEQILDILSHNPHRGMELLICKYTALVWKVSSLHLDDTEDIKENTNDTFAEFYFCMDSYDAEKASLATYLTAISRHLAISRYRREKKHRDNIAFTESAYLDKELSLAEVRADLKQAVKVLKPNELQIIRMKYYDGMTIQEIADSLDLPYETVKKRHQRSVGKLRHALILLLLFILLMACTVSAYEILRYYDLIPDLFHQEESKEPNDDTDDTPDLSLNLPAKNTPDIPQEEDDNTNDSDKEPASLPLSEAQPDTATKPTDTKDDGNDTDSPPSSDIPKEYTIVPGCGVSKDTQSRAYKLEAGVSAQSEEVSVSLENAYYLDGNLNLHLTVKSKQETLSKLDFKYRNSAAIYCNGQSFHNYEDYGRCIDQYYTIFDVQFSDVTITSSEEKLPMELHIYDVVLEFNLLFTPKEEIPSQYAYQMEEDGGLLAIPRLENGSLIVAIYPLDHGEYKTLPGLVLGLHGEKEKGSVITATDEKGTTLTGTCINYYPFSPYSFFEWDFGPAEEGTYTLHVPFLYQTGSASAETSIPINLKDRTFDDTKYEFLGDYFSIASIGEPKTKSDGINIDGEDVTPIRKLYWNVELHYTPTDKNRALGGVFPSLVPHYSAEELENAGVSKDLEVAPYIGSSGVKNFDLHAGWIQLELCLPVEYGVPSSSSLVLSTSTDWGLMVYYRWNQSFDLTFTVESE